MAALSRTPGANLTLNRRGGTLTGMAGGRPIHLLVRKADAVPPGRYQLVIRVHPLHGRVVTAVTIFGNTANHPQSRNVLAVGNTANHPQPRNVLAVGNTANHPSPRHVLAGGIELLLLSAVEADRAPGANVVAIVNGHEDLVAALEASGGGDLQVI